MSEITLHFTARNDPEKEVLDPIRMLTKLAGPGTCSNLQKVEVTLDKRVNPEGLPISGSVRLETL